ncbi:MAG: hypothetical protein ABIG90_00555 [bacterium]
MLNISPIEEVDIIARILYPHFIYPIKTIQQKAILADYIKSISQTRALLLEVFSLEEPAILAGLTKKDIEHIVKQGILEQKQAIFNAFNHPQKQQKILEIAQAMDIKNQTQENTQRIYEITQYFEDNKIIFTS